MSPFSKPDFDGISYHVILKSETLKYLKIQIQNSIQNNKESRHTHTHTHTRTHNYTKSEKKREHSYTVIYY